jgi:hypothetical protein
MGVIVVPGIIVVGGRVIAGNEGIVVTSLPEQAQPDDAPNPVADAAIAAVGA